MQAPATVYDPPKTAGDAIRRLILPLYLPCWFDSVSMGIIGPVLPLFVLSLGATEALTGIVVSTVAAGRLSFSVPGGQLVGKIGEKRTIQLGLLVYMCSSVLLALAPNVPSIIMARLLAGAGQQACGVGRQAFCAAAVATHHRGRVIGLLGGVSRIGGIAGPLIGGFVAQTWGFRAAFLLQASLNLVGVLLIQVFMPTVNAHDSPRGKASPMKSGGAKAAGGGSGCCDIVLEFWVALLTCGVFAMFLSFLRSARELIIPLAGARLGLTVSEVSIATAVGYVVDSVVFPFSAIVMDSRGRRWTGTPASLGMGLGFLVAGLATGFMGLIAAAAVLGFGNGMSAGLIMTLGADLAPADRRGAFIGVFRMMPELGGVVGPVMLGVLLDQFSFWAGSFTCACMGVVSASYMVCCVKETLVKAGARGPYEKISKDEEEASETEEEQVHKHPLPHHDLISRGASERLLVVAGRRRRQGCWRAAPESLTPRAGSPSDQVDATHPPHCQIHINGPLSVVLRGWL